MIFVQGAARIKNPANACFELVESGIVELYLSRETLDEVKDVLSRPIIRRRFPTLTDEMVQAFLSDVESRAVLLKNVPPRFAYPRDPKDEKYIDLAIAAGADYLVSRDNDLLDLMSDVSIEGKQFRQKSRPLKIVEPIEFLRVLAEKDLSLKQ
jgi:putative PIN family toxin of toxin-antitoxin system